MVPRGWKAEFYTTEMTRVCYLSLSPLITELTTEEPLLQAKGEREGERERGGKRERERDIDSSGPSPAAQFIEINHSTLVFGIAMLRCPVSRSCLPTVDCLPTHFICLVSPHVMRIIFLPYRSALRAMQSPVAKKGILVYFGIHTKSLNLHPRSLFLASYPMD